MNKLLLRLFHSLPLLLVIGVALVIAFQNIQLGTIYSGWDNIHAEFNFGKYAHQVIFGAWLENQGLGSPAGLMHVAEIPRLPIVFILTVLLPNDLVRYVFIFASFVIGGLGTYLFLSRYWLKTALLSHRTWLSSVGALFYLLHPLTLQQFYISFELFMVQFAFLPFLLISVHRLWEKTSIRNFGFFILIQLLIAPSGHTPTVFYIGALLSILYAFFLALRTDVAKAISLTLLISVTTFITNAYWIVPNMYYVFQDSHYVQESRENRIFGPESLWSIKEAGTVPNMLKGTHYLLNWKDYDFTTGQHELIFQEWTAHLNQPLVTIFLFILGIAIILGAISLIFDKKQGSQKWAVISMYLICFSFIWIDLLPTKFLLDWLYQSPAFLETFRNPFTKFSITYSLLSTLLLVYALEAAISQLRHRQIPLLKFKAVGLVLSVLIIVGLVYTAWPAFQSQFISEKLRIQYPKQYQELFKYLQSRDRNLRVLELPQLSHAGWEYYDWQFLGQGNGYQGMGFYTFGIPQAFLNRDADRWAESSDFFYHELKNVLDLNDSVRLSQVFQKYNVDLVVVDETRMEPGLPHNYEQDRALLTNAGLQRVWEDEFLTVYERTSDQADKDIFVPSQFEWISANTDRVRSDSAFQQVGNYVLAADNQPATMFPFSQLRATELTNVTFTDQTTEVKQTVPPGNYTLRLPTIDDSQSSYFSPVAIKYEEQKVSFTFPKNSVTAGDQVINLPHLPDFSFVPTQSPDYLIIFFNDIAVVAEKNKTVYPIIPFTVGRDITVEYAPQPEELIKTDSGAIDGSQLSTTVAEVINPNWTALTEEIQQPLSNVSDIIIRSTFPVLNLDLTQNPAVNCVTPEQGSISREVKDDRTVYEADGYAVNCGGYNFDYNSPAYPYLMNVTGENITGRGIKFFISYSEPGKLPEDYVLSQPIFNSTFGLEKVSNNPTSLFYLNWEVRSFGKHSQANLDQIKLTPFPLERMSALQLTTPQSAAKVENKITVTATRNFSDFLQSFDYECAGEKCYVGLDQSYDEGWWAFKVGKVSTLPHFRYNNWANLWEVSGKGNVLIVYWPQAVSLLCLAALLVSLGIVGRKILVVNHLPTPKSKSRSGIKKALLGRTRTK